MWLIFCKPKERLRWPVQSTWKQIPQLCDTWHLNVGYLNVERGFALRPKVREVLTMSLSITHTPSQTIHLMVVRANQRATLMADDYLWCLKCLIQLLIDKGSDRIHSPILDPKRPAYNLINLHNAMMEVFGGNNIHVILRSRVFCIRAQYWGWQ